MDHLNPGFLRRGAVQGKSVTGSEFNGSFPGDEEKARPIYLMAFTSSSRCGGAGGGAFGKMPIRIPDHALSASSARARGAQAFRAGSGHEFQETAAGFGGNLRQQGRRCLHRSQGMMKDPAVEPL